MHYVVIGTSSYSDEIGGELRQLEFTAVTDFIIMYNSEILLISIEACGKIKELNPQSSIMYV